MKATIGMLLFVVLESHLVCNQYVDCRPLEKAETEIAVNNTVSHVHRRNYCVKDCSFDNTHAPICGRQLVYTTYIKREAHDNLHDDINDTPYMDKILGGNYAVYGEIPWVATIMYNFLHICGGAILSEFWVLSAAHCFYDSSQKDYRIAVGDHRLWYKDEFESILQVEQIIKHEGYKKGETEFDIALVKIKRKKNGRGIEFNSHVQPVCLPTSSEVPPVGTELLFAGWGARNEFNSDSSKILKKTSLPVIDFQTCKIIYNDYTNKVFCAGYIDGDTDLCGGDSGGPAAARKDESFILYGISVSGTGCSQPNYPTKCANVARHRFWIDTVIRMYSKDNEKEMPERNYHVVVVPLPD